MLVKAHSYALFKEMRIKDIYKRLTRIDWEIGFVADGLQGVFSDNPQYIWVKNPYKDVCWFADPFILDVTEDYIILLVEEMRYAVHKGRIAKLTINRHTMAIEKMDILLEEDTHLSFPNIWRDGDDIYVYLENHDSGKLNLYRLVDNATRLEKVKVLVDAPLTDAVMTEIFGERQIFSTKMPNPNGDEMYVYTLDRKLDIVDTQSVRLDDKHARMAGQFFEYEGKIYRPAQDCNEQYGGAVIIDEVEKVGGQYVFKPIKRLTSQHPRLRQGMHTLNAYKGVVVIDVKGYKHVLGDVIYFFVRLKKRLLRVNSEE